jgi:hypothetical protein
LQCHRQRGQQRERRACGRAGREEGHAGVGAWTGAGLLAAARAGVQRGGRVARARRLFPAAQHRRLRGPAAALPPAAPSPRRARRRRGGHRRRQVAVGRDASQPVLGCRLRGRGRPRGRGFVWERRSHSSSSSSVIERPTVVVGAGPRASSVAAACGACAARLVAGSLHALQSRQPARRRAHAPHPLARVRTLLHARARRWRCPYATDACLCRAGDACVILRIIDLIVLVCCRCHLRRKRVVVVRGFFRIAQLGCGTQGAGSRRHTRGETKTRPFSSMRSRSMRGPQNPLLFCLNKHAPNRLCSLFARR